MISNGDHHALSQWEAHSVHLQSNSHVHISCFLLFPFFLHHLTFIDLIQLTPEFPIHPENSMHDCENCWGPSLSLDDFYWLETRERGKIMGDCNIECDATLTRPGGMMAGQGSSLISPPIKSCRNIFNWSILEGGEKTVLTWAAVTFLGPNLFSDWSW